MKTIFSLYLSLFLSLTAFAQKENLITQAQTLLDNAIQNGHCEGIGAGTMTSGNITWTGFAGNANTKSNELFGPRTLTRIASITKPMTAVAIMQLVEKGSVKLDDAVSTYIPAFAKAHLESITVRHLLQHSSGIGGYKNSSERQNKKEYSSLEAALTIFVDRELGFKPGSDFAYTTYGYVVLGIVIEKASGLTYEDYLQKNIWEIAGMTHTSVEKYWQAYKGKSLLYHQKKPGKIKLVDLTNTSDRIPGGGVQSTVEDILKFGNAILENKLISAASLEQMIIDSGLKKEGNGYGFGWYLYGQNPNRGSVFGHNGAQLGSSCFLLMIPEQQLAVATLSNTSGALQEVTNIAISLLGIAKDLQETP